MSFEFIYRHWNQVYTKDENLFIISLESEQKQERERERERERVSVVYCSRGIKPCSFVLKTELV